MMTRSGGPEGTRSFGRVVRDNALGSLFIGLFLASLVGQAFAGWGAENDELRDHGASTVGFWEFVGSPTFVVDVAENWQSEFMQFFAFILATIWLVQRGSPESKLPGDEGLGSDKEQLVGRYAHRDSPKWAKAGGWRTAIYSNSLLLAMGAVFLASWIAQAIGGAASMNEERALHDLEPVTFGDYLLSADFWNRTLQNWQSEFLAVAAMVLLTIFLRQRGSHESKPVGAPHRETAVESD